LEYHIVFFRLAREHYQETGLDSQPSKAIRQRPQLFISQSAGIRLGIQPGKKVSVNNRHVAETGRQGLTYAFQVPFLPLIHIRRDELITMWHKT
jgi:hypothetical protein